MWWSQTASDQVRISRSCQRSSFSWVMRPVNLISVRAWRSWPAFNEGLSYRNSAAPCGHVGHKCTQPKELVCKCLQHRQALLQNIKLLTRVYVRTYVSMYLLYLCISMHFYVFLCISMYFYVFLCISMYFYVFLCFYVSMFLSIFLCFYVSMFLSIYLFIYLSICLSVCLSIYVSIYLSIYQSMQSMHACIDP